MCRVFCNKNSWGLSYKDIQMLLYLTFNSACYMTQIFMKFGQAEWISIHIKHKKLLPTYSTIPPMYVKDFLSLLPPGDWYWVCTRSSVCSNCCGKRKRKIDGLLVSFVSRSSSKKNTKKNTLHFGPEVTQVPLLIRFWSRRLASPRVESLELASPLSILQSHRHCPSLSGS